MLLNKSRASETQQGLDLDLPISFGLGSLGPMGGRLTKWSSSETEASLLHCPFSLNCNEWGLHKFLPKTMPGIFPV